MDRKEKDMPKFFHLPDDDVSAPEEEVGRSKTATIRNIAERYVDQISRLPGVCEFCGYYFFPHQYDHFTKKESCLNKFLHSYSMIGKEIVLGKEGRNVVGSVTPASHKEDLRRSKRPPKPTERQRDLERQRELEREEQICRDLEWDCGSQGLASRTTEDNKEDEEGHEEFDDSDLDDLSGHHSNTNVRWLVPPPAQQADNTQQEQLGVEWEYSVEEANQNLPSLSRQELGYLELMVALRDGGASLQTFDVIIGIIARHNGPGGAFHCSSPKVPCRTTFISSMKKKFPAPEPRTHQVMVETGDRDRTDSIQVVSFSLKEHLEHLLIDPSIFGNTDNLVTNGFLPYVCSERDDPHGGELVASRWYRDTVVSMNIDPRRDFLLPIIMYADKTGMDILAQVVSSPLYNS